MTKQITLEELLEVVTVKQTSDGLWQIIDVKCTIYGDVYGIVFGNVKTVGGDVLGNVLGNVGGTINGREWQYVETPKDKFKRLLKETGNQELIEAFYQLENN